MIDVIKRCNVDWNTQVLNLWSFGGEVARPLVFHFEGLPLVFHFTLLKMYTTCTGAQPVRDYSINIKTKIYVYGLVMPSLIHSLVLFLFPHTYFHTLISTRL